MRLGSWELADGVPGCGGMLWGKVIGQVEGRVESECWIQHGLMGRLAGGQCMLLNGSACPGHYSQHTLHLWSSKTI